jgi:hypothetical protein
VYELAGMRLQRLLLAYLLDTLSIYTITEGIQFVLAETNNEDGCGHGVHRYPLACDVVKVEWMVALT